MAAYQQDRGHGIHRAVDQLEQGRGGHFRIQNQQAVVSKFNGLGRQVAVVVMLGGKPR